MLDQLAFDVHNIYQEFYQLRIYDLFRPLLFIYKLAISALRPYFSWSYIPNVLPVLVHKAALSGVVFCLYEAVGSTN